MPQSITIRIKPYLKEFIVSRLEEPPNSSLRTMIGAVIVPFVERMPKDAKPVIGTGDDYLTIDLVHLNSKFQRDIRGSFWISEENQQNITRILEAHFIDLFFQYVDDKRRYDLVIQNKRFLRGQLKLIITQFCADNRIPFNHINYEMLKKKYYRRCQKEFNIKKQFVSLSKSSLLFLV